MAISVYPFYPRTILIVAHVVLVLRMGMVSFAQEKEPCLLFLMDMQDKSDKTMVACLKSSGLGELAPFQAAVKKNNGSLENFDYDDKCFYQCVYQGFGLTNDDGSMKLNEVKNIFKGNIFSLTMVAFTWDTCISDAEKIGKSKGLTPCKVHALHSSCFLHALDTDKTFEEENVGTQAYVRPKSAT